VATKSLVIRVEVDHAVKAHNCQASKRHRLQRGDRRLKVRNGRSWDHYCVSCATNILARDLDKLRALLAQFASGSVSREEPTSLPRA
jgi:hypothetical protein